MLVTVLSLAISGHGCMPSVQFLGLKYICLLWLEETFQFISCSLQDIQVWFERQEFVANFLKIAPAMDFVFRNLL